MSFKEKFCETFGKIRFTMKKNAPAIMTGVGVVGVVGTVVLAVRATIKATETIEEHNDERAELIDSEAERGTEEVTKEVRKLYFRTAGKIAREFAPVAITGTVSIGLLIGSHKILNKKNLSLMAAYAGLDQSFKQYRGRVVDRYGDEVDYELRTGARMISIKETVTDEDGKEHRVNSKVRAVDAETVENNEDLYVKYLTRKNFDHWDPNPAIVEATLTQAQSIFNEALQFRKVVTLNEVYDYFGFARTKAGMTVGWLYRDNPENSQGDNFIQITAKRVKVFMEDTQEYEDAYALDFNVDGPIDKEIERVAVGDGE